MIQIATVTDSLLLAFGILSAGEGGTIIAGCILLSAAMVSAQIADLHELRRD